jgi:hypothetical protein
MKWRAKMKINPEDYEDFEDEVIKEKKKSKENKTRGKG